MTGDIFCASFPGNLRLIAKKVDKYFSTLWQFQNGKLGQSSQKIDQDTRNNVKAQFLKYRGFCYKITRFLMKTNIFHNSNF